MADRAALLAAILADPEDDAPRLIYADWLQERGEGERAEFIRRQVWGQEPPATLTVEVMDFVTRTDVKWLVSWNGGPVPDWLKRMPLPFDVGGIHELCRGFVHSVTCTAAAWLAHAERIIAEHPVRLVQLTSLTPNDFDAVEVAGGRWYSLAMPMPDGSAVFGVGRDRRGAIADLLARRWPGVEFELPPEPLINFQRTQRFIRYVGTVGGATSVVPIPHDH